MVVAYYDTLHFLIADLNLHLFAEMLKWSEDSNLKNTIADLVKAVGKRFCGI